MKCRNYLVEEDLQRFLDDHEAGEAFRMLDEDNDERVTLREMRETITNIYKVRQAWQAWAHSSFTYAA